MNMIDIDRDDPRATIRVEWGGKENGYIVTSPGPHRSRIVGTMRKACALLRAEGYLRLEIDRGGAQRRRIEVRYL
jgi:hypothetical protein